MDDEIGVEGSILFSLDTFHEVSSLFVDPMLQTFLADSHFSEGAEAESPQFFGALAFVPHEASCLEKIIQL